MLRNILPGSSHPCLPKYAITVVPTTSDSDVIFNQLLDSRPRGRGVGLTGVTALCQDTLILA